ncbi:hypothetical protein AB6A40_005873 [Gnathostoma spinigerum]|uniref:Uncharacterized protein n=1 Tax=Gnathostoma spinigerum TaxID=75299 RepID=A0ABD6ELY7_9BILA
MEYNSGLVPQKKELNPEEIQFLLQKISSDEQAEIAGILKSCTTEMTLYRGLPFTAAVVGSLYYSRQRLPSHLHFGPKGWPFYVFVGISALTAANLLSMSTCKERISPKLSALWDKYTMDSGASVTYQDLQRQNRHQYSTPLLDKREQPSLFDSSVSSLSDPYQKNAVGRERLPFMYDQPVYMSGTPTGPPVSGGSADFSLSDEIPSMNTARKTQYNDEGFS